MIYDQKTLEKKMDSIITLYINPSIGTPSELRKEVIRCLSGEANELAIEGMKLTRTAFQDFLTRKYMDVDQFDEETNGLYMKSKKAIYQYMRSVYDFAYDNGPEPDWRDYVHPANL